MDQIGIFKVSFKYVFEFDSTKSEANLRKHGIDFKQATSLWDEGVVVLKSRNRAEDRSLVIGRIRNEFWTAIITYREDRIRIISVRRARHEEKELYESHHR